MLAQSPCGAAAALPRPRTDVLPLSTDRTDVAVHAAWLEPAAAGGTARLRLEIVTGRDLHLVGITSAVAGRTVLDETHGRLATRHRRLATCLATSGCIRLEELRRPLRHGERVTCTMTFADGTACRIDCTTREDWLRAPRPRDPRVRLRTTPGQTSA